jgi:hypothetical protein
MDCALHIVVMCTSVSTHIAIRQHTSAYVSIRLNTSAYVSIRQHTSAYVCIRQHTSAYVSIRQHTSAYVSIRQHTSAYVSIRQHTSSSGLTPVLSHLQPSRWAHSRESASWPPPYTVPASAYVSIRPYVSIRKHTSAYVAPPHAQCLRQHT